MISVMVVSQFVLCFFFFFKQKTAYEMRISDWSSDVCSSDLLRREGALFPAADRGDADLPQAGPDQRTGRRAVRPGDAGDAGEVLRADAAARTRELQPRHQDARL